VLERAHITPQRDRLIANLSKGYQQRVGIAQALLGNPPVLILDEPTVGLDPRQIGEVRKLIRELAGDHTVILSTHILQEVTATCERVIIINQGRIVADDPITHLVARHRQPHKEPSLEEIFLSLTEV
jgi:ABC-2 type transport system ATP-binding protein